ncbi:MAG: chorismate synthase [Oscillospiraceae bacterium]|nr:chorismate synthase [Oscillospiraceae bacterium]
MWNRGIGISVFGESHGPAIGVTIENLPSGQAIDMDKVMRFMQRRAPGYSEISTPRKEADIPSVLSGIYNGFTTGTPLTCVINNTDTRSSDYADIPNRPGHADYTGFVRYGGYADPRGGGHFSGRLTAPLTFAGAICGQILESHGIFTGAHISSVADITDRPFDRVNVNKDMLLRLRDKPIPVNDDSIAEKIIAKVKSAMNEKDSIGGVIECAIVGLAPGIGSPIFGGIENEIAAMIFAVPAVKGIEFGAGFACSDMLGSECNDEFYIDSGSIKTKTNNNGGILGGISTGMPICFRAAIKPTPSIAKEQKTVCLRSGKETVISVQGRHDPCIAVRAVPVIEAAANIAVMGVFLASPFGRGVMR